MTPHTAPARRRAAAAAVLAAPAPVHAAGQLLPSHTLVLFDALQREPPPHWLPGDLLSVEAAIAACERFGLGERLVAVLEAEQERVQAAVAKGAAAVEKAAVADE